MNGSIAFQSTPYIEALNHSMMLEDLKSIVALMKRLEATTALGDASGFVHDGEVALASPNDYLLGKAWFDTEGEIWRFDYRAYGERL